MYRSNGPNTGSIPEGGQIEKKQLLCNWVRGNNLMGLHGLHQLQQPSEYSAPETQIHLNTGQYGCCVFKWSRDLADNLDTGYLEPWLFFSPLFRPPLEYWTN